MHVSILGDGALAAPLTQLSKRAGHTVGQIQEDARTATPYGASDLLILVGSRIAVADTLERLGAVRDDVVIVDATTLDTLEEQRAT